MPDISVTINQEQLDDLKTRLAEIKNGVPMALTRAINKTCTSTRTDMIAMVKETHNYYADVLRSRIIIHKATWSKLSAKVVSTGQPINLFDMIGTSWPGPHSTGVRVNVEKATGTQVLTKGWFGPAKKGGGTQNVGKPIVYARTKDPGISRRTEPPGRYPIRGVTAPHPEVVYYQPKVWKSIQFLVDFNLEKHLNHEVDAIIQKYAPSDEGLE
jgi:hypothetical protein